MIPVLWGLIVAVGDLLWLLAELGLGMLDGGYSYSTTVLWLIVPPIGAVGAMAHARKLAEGPFGYWRAVRSGVLATLLGTIGAVAVWALFVLVIEPMYFSIMIDYSMMVAKAAPNVTKQYLAAQLTASLLIYSIPNFFIVSAVLPMISGSLAALIAGAGLRRRVVA